MPKDRLMLDTNIFNHVLDDAVPVEELHRQGDLFVTPVQHQELSNTKDPLRRDDLSGIFKAFRTQERPLQTAVWGHGTWGGGQTWGQRGPHFDAMLQALKAPGGRRAKSPGNTGDSLTAEVCLSEGITLVTDDGPLTAVAQKSGITTLTLMELLARPKEEP